MQSKISIFTLALVQMKVEAGQPSANLQRALENIRRAAAQGASLIVLPEAMTLGWTDPSALSAAEEIPHGRACYLLRESACRHQAHICSGLVERAGDRVYNAAVLVGPQGEVLLHHRKIHELEIGHQFYACGDRLQVAHTPLGTIGLMICADAFVRGQVISRTLGYMGAQLIVSPSSWAVPADHDNQKEPYGQLWLDNYRPVARDFRMWIAGVSNVGWIPAGPWQGRKCIGCSLVVGPEGQPVVMGPYGPDAETILYVDVQLENRPGWGESWERVWKEQAAPGCGST